MQEWERDALDLAAERRLDGLQRKAIGDTRYTCRCCDRPIHYSVPDTVYVHENGRYFCDTPPLFERHAQR